MIRLIVAYDRERGLGKFGFQPWKIPEDEAYFVEKTKSNGGVILVGSTTFKTFSDPLAERRNYVLTSDKTPIDGAELVHNLKKFLNDFSEQDVWVIGGANVFEQVLETGAADEVYATAINADFGCTQFFPDISSRFQLVSQSDLHEQNGFIFSYEVYKKSVAE